MHVLISRFFADGFGKYRKRSQKVLKMRKSMRNECKRKPNRAKRLPKSTNMRKLIPTGPKKGPKGAKSEPKDDQNASKNRPSEKVAKREPKGTLR